MTAARVLNFANSAGDRLTTSRVVLSGVTYRITLDFLPLLDAGAGCWALSMSTTRGEVVAVGQATESEIQTVSVAMGAQTGSIAPEGTLLDKATEKALRVLVNDFAGNVTPKK